ncbi:hypothetical protein GCM10027321_07180 [Massilia terrae]|uniref:Uncharacterized protein n=1 Tax=Massilia terrae TaxID=1811224 RepID=A0ABT2D0Z6_9BURK|nr:hypothetical protein [Massilia terrae]MCS0659710.1 hypothetical protein [Massilia terrae]
MDTAIKDKVLAVTRLGRTRAEATDWFRVSLGLYYLAGLMTNGAIDFKLLDRAYNRFIYHAIGGGHSITSVLQFMSGVNVLPVVQSERFVRAFGECCPEIPLDTIPFLLSLNLGVAKNISKLDVGGPLHDWIEGQQAAIQRSQADGGAAEPDSPAGGERL